MRNLVSLVCTRCGSRMVPAISGWRCPRMTSCGFGGSVEADQPSSVKHLR